ncbi:MAG TPA: hypothetical protein VFE53_16010 [Mucilaginibacter sp.]|jgi:hypothetical protein|nr:hypothetical protein [Mucilaginibacter sp.]
MAAIFNLKALGFLALSLFFITDNLAYRDAENGKVKILVPANFLHLTKQNMPKRPGEDPPDDYFFSKDTTEEILFLTFPSYAANLNSARPMMDGAMRMAKKVYFNDTTTVSGIKMYLTEYDLVEKGKTKYVRAFIFNIGNSTLLGGISCNIALKTQWQPIGEKILKSLRIETK